MLFDIALAATRLRDRVEGELREALGERYVSIRHSQRAASDMRRDSVVAIEYEEAAASDRTERLSLLRRGIETSPQRRSRPVSVGERDRRRLHGGSAKRSWRRSAWSLWSRPDEQRENPYTTRKRGVSGFFTEPGTEPRRVASVIRVRENYSKVFAIRCMMHDTVRTRSNDQEEAK